MWSARELSVLVFRLIKRRVHVSFYINKKRLRTPGGGMGALAKKAAASVAVAAPAPAPDQAVEPPGAEERPDAPLTHASKERGPSWAERAQQLQQLDQYQDAVKG